MSDTSVQHILVFGATGGTGKAFVEQALEHGHAVTAYVRDPSKLEAHEKLTIIEGDLFDAEAVKGASTPGMTAAGISRLVAVSSMGASDTVASAPSGCAWSPGSF